MKCPTPCSLFTQLDNREKLKVIAATNAFSEVNGNTIKNNNLFENYNYSSFLLRSYEDVKSAKQYQSAVVDAIKIVEYFGGKVGSVTADGLPYSRLYCKVLININ
jgi:hypothetical protein